MKIITALVPDLSPDRALALEPLRARVDAAQSALAAARFEYGPVVERLARIDLVRLRPRIKKEFINTVGSLRAVAIDLRVEFDHADVPVDLRDAFRAATGARSDAEFTNAMQQIMRDADRYTGTVEHVDVLTRRLVAALAVLEDAGDIFSDVFVVEPRQEFGFIAEGSNSPKPAAVAVAK
jgi:hypothetical protein